MTPPAIENSFNPAATATSENRPMSSLDSNALGGIRYFCGTAAGYLPRVTWARFRSHLTSRSSGLVSRYFVKYWIAFIESLLISYLGNGLPGRGGNRHRSQGV